jgi:hypothetical protein
MQSNLTEVDLHMLLMHHCKRLFELIYELPMLAVIRKIKEVEDQFWSEDPKLEVTGVYE